MPRQQRRQAAAQGTSRGMAHCRTSEARQEARQSTNGCKQVPCREGLIGGLGGMVYGRVGGRGGSAKHGPCNDGDAARRCLLYLLSLRLSVNSCIILYLYFYIMNDDFCFVY